MLAATPSVASAAEPGEALTWQQCLSIAAQKNPDLASASRAVEANQATYQGSLTGFLPQLTLGHGYTNSNGTALGASSASEGSVTGASTYHWQAQGTASVNLFDMGQIAGVRSASAALAQAQANLRLASAAVRLSLRQAFDQLLFTQKNIEVSRAILDMRQKSAQLVSLRYNSGRESKGNMMRSNAQALQAQEDLAQAGRDLRTAQIALARQLGREDFQALTLDGTLETSPPPDLPGNLESMLGARPEVVVQEAVVRVAEASVQSAEKGWWPTLSLSYGRQRLGTSEFPSDRDAWTFNAGLTYSLFGGGLGASYFATTAAQKNLEKVEQDLRSAREQAMLSLESAWSNFAGAYGQVKVQNALLEAARQRNGEADVRYASGLLTYDEWEIIASDRINQERQAVQAQLNVANGEAAWQEALGKTIEERE